MLPGYQDVARIWTFVVHAGLHSSHESFSELGLRCYQTRDVHAGLGLHSSHECIFELGLRCYQTRDVHAGLHSSYKSYSELEVSLYWSSFTGKTFWNSYSQSEVLQLQY